MKLTLSLVGMTSGLITFAFLTFALKTDVKEMGESLRRELSEIKATVLRIEERQWQEQKREREFAKKFDRTDAVEN